MPRRPTLLAAGALLLAVAALWAWLELVGPLPGERAALDWQETHERFSRETFWFVGWFVAIGNRYVAVVVVAAIALVVAEARGVRDAVAVVAAAAVVALTTALKALLGPTPLWSTVHGDGNFPSGHSAFAAALFGLLAWWSWSAGRPVAATVLAGFAVAAGCAMVVWGAHLPSDVLAGWAIGVAWLLGVLLVRTSAPSRARVAA